MKLQFKILCINIALAIAAAFFSVVGAHYMPWEDFFSVFGMIALLGGVCELVVGLFLLMLEDKRYAQGFLLSGGILLLLGFLACTAAIAGI